MSVNNKASYYGRRNEHLTELNCLMLYLLCELDLVCFLWLVGEEAAVDENLVTWPFLWLWLCDIMISYLNHPSAGVVSGNLEDLSYISSPNGTFGVSINWIWRSLWGVYVGRMNSVDSLFPFFRKKSCFFCLRTRTCTWTVIAWMLFFLCALIPHCNSQKMKSTHAGQTQLRASLWHQFHLPSGQTNPCWLT